MEILEEYKDKITNAPNYEAAIELIGIASSLTDNANERDILNSLAYPDKYNSIMPTDKYLIYLNMISSLYYKEDALLILADIETMTLDKSQVHTLRKIIQRKPDKPLNLSSMVSCTKPCPHCGKSNSGSNCQKYIICGYTLRGFNWEGCGKDWCFKCGKKLCKSWDKNELYNLNNRQHNGKCCKHHAQKNNNKYPDDYCMCDKLL